MVAFTEITDRLLTTSRAAEELAGTFGALDNYLELALSEAEGLRQAAEQIEWAMGPLVRAFEKEPGEPLFNDMERMLASLKGTREQVVKVAEYWGHIGRYASALALR